MNRFLQLAIYVCTLMYAGYGFSAEIKINASAAAKPIRLTDFYAGYHHNRFYYEQTPAFKKAHDIINECSHKRKVIQYIRLQNIFTYRNDDPNNPTGDIRNYTEVRSGHPYDTYRYASTGGYNWNKVDQVYDELVTRNGFTPIIEFNYMPECLAADPTEVGSYGIACISPPKDYNEWSSLCRNTARHFQDRYGVQETRNWWFGVWNEPNYEQFWDFGKYGYDGFIKIYDYSSIPVKEVDNQLRIGGPDNTAVLTYSKRYVQHTYNGENYSTGQVGSPADYFSVHAYSTSPRFICGEIWKMARDVEEIYGTALAQGKSFLLTECAPSFQMRNMPYMHNRYTAAWLLACVDVFLEAADAHGEYWLPKTMHYCGILREFGKRSVMVYMGENNDSEEVLKTPLFNVYETLSYMSDERLPVDGCDLPDNYVNVYGNSNNSFSQVRCLATRTPGQSVEILVYHFKEGSRLVYNKKDDGNDPAQPYGTYYRSTPLTHSVDVLVENLPFTNARYRKFVIDKDHSNSLAYKTMNNADSYDRLNAHDDLEEVETKIISFSNNEFRESLTLQENSITLIILENNNVEPGPHLGLSTNSVDFGIYATTKTFSVYNYGDQPLTWNAIANGNELIQSVEPANGTLQPNMSEIVTVTVDRSNLSDGTYNENIQFTSNGGDAAIAITGSVGGPPLPSFYRINAGGYSYTDANGDEWLSDRGYAPGGCGYVGGKTSNTSDPITRTEKDILYQTERYDLKSYQFDLPKGSYQVVLHFAEIYFDVPNERIMSVAIEGNVRVADMDLFNEVGHDAALIRTFSNVDVTDGTLNIDFSATSRVPKISAIEVVEMSLVEPGADIQAPNPPAGVQVRRP